MGSLYSAMRKWKVRIATNGQENWKHKQQQTLLQKLN
jgi:hypothetical protein